MLFSCVRNQTIIHKFCPFLGNCASTSEQYKSYRDKLKTKAPSVYEPYSVDDVNKVILQFLSIQYNKTSSTYLRLSL